MAKSNIAFFDTSFALENLLNLRASGVLPLDPTRTLTCTQTICLINCHLSLPQNQILAPIM